MHCVIKKLVLPLLIAALAPAVMGFSLLGPFKPWQVTAIGYNISGNEIGAPMELPAAYRWNVTNVTYAFDESFIKYFGTNGMKAVDDAFAILNNLPPASRINLDDYPLDTKLQNYTAYQAGILDIKSITMTMMMFEMGLAEPERWVWCLRGRNTETIGGVTYTNYLVIKQNYDPYTLKPSSIVNGVTYTYQIQDPIAPQNYADAIESPVGVSERLAYSSVASGTLLPGDFYFGLSRDDVGGIKFLLSTNNLAVEGVLTNVTGNILGAGAFGWVPWFGGTNAVLTTNFFNTTNLAGLTNGSNFVAVGLRGGGNKITFTKVYYDSLLGSAFQPITNGYLDNVLVTNKLIQQRLQRVISQPDIVFVAEDLGLFNNIDPFLTATTGTAGWVNNDAINGLATAGGPGVIQGQVRLSFTTLLPYFLNQTPNQLGEIFYNPVLNLSVGTVWGSFDHTAKPPIIYPEYMNLTVEDLLGLLSRYTNSIPR
ncbi:MAG: hypothetical protein HZA90_22120 [Verrucomicrobia bacterium]|nr:hypothetical protein [Verrucomicrobiota bacterium]